MDTNILLENGTNELEVLEFTLGKNHYGIKLPKSVRFCHISRSHRFQMQILVLKESLCRVML